MTRAIITTSFNRIVGLQEIVDRLAEIDVRNALAVITKVSARHLWFPQSEALAAYINLVNLSHLAKAVVLYSADSGRPMNLASDETGDLQWLLTAVNSMQWYSRAEIEGDNDEAIISFLVRQTYVRNFVGDHPVSSIARAYAMFYELLPALNRGRVDVDGAMQAVAGVNCHDLWVFCAAIHFFYFLESTRPDGPWSFRPDFFADSPRRNELAESLGRVLNRIAKTPQELRTLYNGRKYHDPSLPEEYWLSEFNILRDYPVIKIGTDDYCCPYTTFAWMRGAVGYYFDLVNHYADIERRENPRNWNPFDNIMSQVLGDVFQEYVGVHLRSLPMAATDLRAEFIYNVGRDELRTPDWILLRVPTLPVYFECKARRPALPLQARCRPTDREAEIESVLSRALGQLTVFLRNVISRRVPGLTLTGDWHVVYALVLYETFPFHALPDIRDLIDSIAERLEPDWRQFRNHVLFVPMSIQELELAVQLEKEQGVLIEHQFQAYALYRRTAPRMVMSGGRPIFARHFLDFAFERWGAPANAPGEVCVEYWNRFCRLLYSLLYGEDLADYEARQRSQWIEENAYFQWVNAGRPVGTALDHWLAAERDYEGLERSLGMAPYMAARLNANYAITRSLEGFA